MTRRRAEGGTGRTRVGGSKGSKPEEGTSGPGVPSALQVQDFRYGQRGERSYVQAGQARNEQGGD